MNAPASVRERGIAMVAAMVLAALEDRKTNTRRLLDARHPVHFIGGAGEQSDLSCWGYHFDGSDQHGWMVLARGFDERHDHGRVSIPCPYGVPGDRLWVREAWRTGVALDSYNATQIAELCVEAGWKKPWTPIIYPADGCTDNADTLRDFGGAWGRLRAARFMPRWASRIDLRVTDVRIERLQEITEADARAEGVELFDGSLAAPLHHVVAFAGLWDAINGSRAPWASNPWIWRIAFERVK
jgi:hypothetical protein